MPKRTPFYNFYTLEYGDKIYPGFDQDNFFTIENETYGIFTYLGPGVITGWDVTSMKYDPTNVLSATIELEKQQLIDAYRTNIDSYQAQQYIALDYPTQDWEWGQIVRIAPGSGIVGPYPAKTNNSHYFRLTDINLYYAWATWGPCIDTEGTCSVSVPLDPDEDYDISNLATFLSEVQVGQQEVYLVGAGNVTLSSGSANVYGNGTSFLSLFQNGDLIKINNDVYTIQSIQTNTYIILTTNATTTYVGSNYYYLDLKNQIVNINYTERRNNLKSFSSLQDALKAKFLRHVHTGVGEEPSKIDLSSELVLDCAITEGSDILTFTPPSGGFSKYGIPVVLLNNVALNISDYNLLLTGHLYLKNSLSVSDTVQIILPLSPQTILTVETGFIFNLNTPFPLTTGATQTSTDEDGNPTTTQITFAWSSANYEDPQVYAKTTLLSTRAYSITPGQGTITFLSPLPPGSTSLIDITVVLTAIGKQFQNILPGKRTQNINASTFTKGTLDANRLTQLDHVGLFRYRDHALFIPTLRLLPRGDQTYFYPENTNSDLQYSSTVNFGYESSNYYLNNSAFLLATQHGLVEAQGILPNYIKFQFSPYWFTDVGEIAEIYDEYWGELTNYKTGSQTNLDYKEMFIRTVTAQNLQGRIFYSTNKGKNWYVQQAPFVNSAIPNIQSFYATQDIVATTGEFFDTYQVNRIYYLGTDKGFFLTTVLPTQGPTDWVWSERENAGYSIGTGPIDVDLITNINDIKEAVNINIMSQTDDQGNTTTTYLTVRHIYLATNLGLFQGTGLQFFRFEFFYDGIGNLYTPPVNSILWLENGARVNYDQFGLYWASDSDIFASYYADQEVVSTESASNTTYHQPLPGTTSFSFADVDYTYDLNVNLNRAPALIAGVNLSLNKRILVKSQTDLTQNGIYYVSSVTSDSGGPYTVWTRTAENAYASLATVRITNTSPTYPNSIWFLQALANNSGFTLGSSPVIWKIAAIKLYSHILDGTHGPFIQLVQRKSNDQLYAIHTKGIYWIKGNTMNTGFVPSVQSLVWDVAKYGTIKNVYHVNLGNKDYGTLYVFTDSGLYQSTPTLFDSNYPGYPWIRAENVFDSSLVTEISVYNEQNLNQIQGKLTGITSTVNILSGTIPDGIYNNVPLIYSGSQGYNASVNVTVASNLVTAYSISNGGRNFASDLYNAQAYIQGTAITFTHIISEGVTYIDYPTQSITFSQLPQPNYVNYLYAKEYENFYVRDWPGSDANNSTFVAVYIGDTPTSLSLNLIPDQGLIQFANSVGLANKDNIYATIIKDHAYITNVGQTPHEELTGTFLTSSASTTTLNKEFTTQTALPVTSYSSIPPSTTYVKLVATNLVPDILQIYVDVINQTINVLSRSTSQAFPSGTQVYVVTDGKQLGIQDKLTLAKTNLTYNLQSIENQNTVQLATQAGNFYNLFSSFYNPGVNDAPYSEIDRGLKNTISATDGSNIFNNPGSSSSLYIGVSPSVSDNAAVPKIIFTFSGAYGNNPLIVGTERGIWQYDHNTSRWSQQSSLNASGRVFFINNNYAGSATGLWNYTNSQWTPSTLYTQEILDYQKSQVWDTNATTATYYDAYAKSDGLAFVYYKDSTLATFTSDYFTPLVDKTIYGLYHDYFQRATTNSDGSVNLTLTPALYLCAEDGLWATTLGGNSGGLGSLLGGREVLVANNPSIMVPLYYNGILVGTRTPKIYKIVRTINPTSISKQPIPILVLSSNGIFKVMNWRACDPTDNTTVDFVISNLNNCLLGRSCYCIAQKAYINSTVSFVGTDNGVYRTDNNGDTFSTTEKIAGGATTVYSLQIVTGADNVDYIIAGTDQGLFVSPDLGQTWLYPDDASISAELRVSRYVSNSIMLDSNYYGQSFTINSSLNQQFSTSGTINKAAVYLSTISTGNSIADKASANNTIQASIVLYDGSGNIISTVMANNTVLASSIQYPSFVSFVFNPFVINASQNAILIIKEVLSGDINATYVTRWHTSNLNDPFTYGKSLASASNLTNFNNWTPLQTGLDFYFKVFFAYNNIVQIVQEPVGFLNTSSNNGFLTGSGRGFVLDRNGYLTTDTKVLASLAVDYSKSINWTEPLDNSNNNVQVTDFTKYILTNSDSLWARTNNQSYLNIWQFGTYITNTSNGLENNTITLENYLLEITNRGKSSPLFDGLAQSLISLYPQSVIEQIIQPIDDTSMTIDQQQLIVAENINNLQALQTYLNAQNLIYFPAIEAAYKATVNNYAELTVLNITGPISIGTLYSLTDNTELFTWSEDYYQNTIITVAGVAVAGATLYPTTGQISFNINYGNLQDVKIYLSLDWTLDPTTFAIIDADWIYSDYASNEIVAQWASSYVPLAMVIADGDDTSTSSTLADVLALADNLWDGDGVGVQAFALNRGNTQKNLRDVTSNSTGVFYDISDANNDWGIAYNSLYNSGANSLFTATWSKTYDFETLTFIKRVVSQYSYNSTYGANATVQFRYSLDRVNYSNWISVSSGSAGTSVMQSIYIIEYRITLIEGWTGSAKSRPSVSQLYHETVVPAYQYLFTNSYSINGMLFEYISSASLNKSNLTSVNFGICRGDSLDYSYYEPIILGRDGVLTNRQNTILYTTETDYKKIALQTQDNQTFYVLDDKGNPITWTVGEDVVKVYQIINNQNRYYDPQFYQQFGESSKIIFNTVQVGIGTLYTDITIVPKLYTLVGEKCITNDFQTYYLSNGIFPPDASVIVLVNNQVQRGGFVLSGDTGSFTFNTVKDRTDVVTAYVQFSSTFRVGMQVVNYTSDTVSLGDFALIYTVKNNGDVIRDYNNFPIPEINNLQLLPLNPNFTNSLNISYNFTVIKNAVESGTKTVWYRLRTGLETIAYNNNSVTPAPGSDITVVLSSVAPVNPNAVGYALNVSLSSAGKVTGISIASRGYLLDPLSPPNVSDTAIYNGITYSGFQSIFGSINVFNANNVNAAYQYTVGINTYVQITASNLIGVASANGITTNLMPEYDNRFSEKSIDVSNRTTFDGYDSVFVTVQPSTALSVGGLYKSNTIIIRPAYTPTIVGSPQYAVQYIGTSPLTVANGQTIPVSYSFLSNQPGATAIQKSGLTGIGSDIVKWYTMNKGVLSDGEGASIYTGAILPSSYVITGTQLYYLVTPVNGPDVFGIYDQGISHMSDVILIK